MSDHANRAARPGADAPTAAEVLELIRRMDLRARTQLFRELDHRHNSIVAPTGYGVAPVEITEACRTAYRRQGEAFLPLVSLMVRLGNAQRKRSPGIVRRDAEIVRLRDQPERPSFGKIALRLRRINPSWTGPAGKALAYDTVKKAYQRMKRDPADS
jgi:hypothetical protein